MPRILHESFTQFVTPNRLGTGRNARRERPARTEDLVARRRDGTFGQTLGSSGTRVRRWIATARAALVAQLFRRVFARIIATACAESVFFDVTAVPREHVAIAAFGFFVDAVEPILILARTTDVTGLLHTGIHVADAVFVLRLCAAFAAALEVADQVWRCVAAADDDASTQCEDKPGQDPRSEPRFGSSTHPFYLEHRLVLLAHGPPDDPTDELELVQSTTQLA